MILSCVRCGTAWNNETVNRCPSCNINRKKKKRNKKNPFADIEKYKADFLRQSRRQVNSFRTSQVSKWEREHQKSVYESF